MCYLDTDTFIVIYYVYRWFYKDIAEDDETRIDTLNYELYRRLPKGKNKKVIGLRIEKLIRLKNPRRVFWVKSKNLYLPNSWW